MAVRMRVNDEMFYKVNNLKDVADALRFFSDDDDVHVKAVLFNKDGDRIEIVNVEKS